MIQENITLILLALIVLVFLIDFIKNNSKKSINESVQKFVKKEEKLSSNKQIFIKSFFLLLLPVFFMVFLLELYGIYGRMLPDKLSDLIFVELYFPYYNLLYNGETDSIYFQFFLPMYVLFSFCVSYLKSCNLNIFDFFSKRKKNISFALILICFLKVLTHFVLFPNLIEVVVDRIVVSDLTAKIEYGGERIQEIKEMQPMSLGSHFECMFTERLELFIPITIVFLIVIWFFNDKIKAQ